MFWVDVHAVRTKHEASTQAKLFSQFITWIRVFWNFFRPSNISYQTWRSKGQQVWLIFWRLGFQTSASRQTIMSQVNISRVMSGHSPSTQFQLRGNSVVKQAVDVRCSFSLVACDAVYIIRWTVCVSGIMVPWTSRLNVIERAEMISSDIWKKDQDWSRERTDRGWWLQGTVRGGRRRMSGLEKTGRKRVQYNKIKQRFRLTILPWTWTQISYETLSTKLHGAM